MGISANILDQIKNSVIVSCQAQADEPFYDAIAMGAMIKSVVNGGAEGLRLAGMRDIKMARKLYPEMPIIGITKPAIIPQNYKELVYITPSLEDVELVAAAGADIVAFDATLREHKVEIKYIINKIHSLGKLAMADISNFEEGKNAAALGSDLISTTLSGYTQNCQNKTGGPDFELLKNLVKNVNCPIVLEGRINEPTQAKMGFELGAHCVVIGSAITRPQEITKRYINEVKQ